MTMKGMFNVLRSNIQLLQTLVLSSILFIGVFFYKIDVSILEIFVTFFTVIVLDFLFRNKEKVKQIFGHKDFSDLEFPYSGVNAAFGICFFLRTDELILYFIAAIIAISSKYFIIIREKHFLNPSNAAVFLLLILFPQYTWVNPLQWGNYSSVNIQYLMSFFLVILLGIFMAFMVYKTFKFVYLVDYILPFLLTHFILFFIIPYAENWSSFFTFFNTSFMVFTFFMITDPKTIPTKQSSRFLYAISIVLSFYVLNFVINENYAILGSLFVNTLFLPLIWRKEQKKFKGMGESDIVILFWIAIQIILILIGILYLGPPDLTFDNVCNQLFCKNIF